MDHYKESFVNSHKKMFEYFGAVPLRVKLDNLKSGVIKSDLYDPVMNRCYAEMAEHYAYFLEPCRVHSPNDSYPIFVQSGARVRVTPSNSTAPETKLLSEISDALNALNINRTAGTRQKPVTLKLFLDGRELAKSKSQSETKMHREGNMT